MLELVKKFLSDPTHYFSKFSLKYSHRFIPNFLMYVKTKNKKKLHNFYDSFTNDIIISFPLSVPFNFMLQRPQQLAKQFATIHNVFYYTGCFLYNPDKIYGTYRSESKLHLINDGVNGNSVFKLNCKMHYIYLYLPADHYHYLSKIPKNAKVIYDYLDDISLSPRYSKKLKKKHNEILRRSDLIVTTASKLYDSVPKIYKNKTLLITNGVEYERFNLRNTNYNERPIICFYGSLAHWINADIFMDILKSDKFYLRLLGPVHDKKFKKVINHKNCEYLGYVDYNDLISNLSGVDAFVMPFELNKITMSVSPVKLFEHMATGLPIISTPISEVKKYKTIFLSNRRGFVKKIDEALKFRGNDEYINANKKYASENSWHKKATKILNYFDLS